MINFSKFAFVNKKEYKDATHNVPAYVIGDKMQIQWGSDDGEPQGTSGAPIVQMLVSEGLTNVCVVVTRYFGGTLLGTGGLVHAYSDSAKQVLSICKSEPYVEKRIFSFNADYSLYETRKRKYEVYHISDVVEEYSSDVAVKGIIWAQEAEMFASIIKDLSKGRTEVVLNPCT